MKSRVLSLFSFETTGVFLASFGLIATLLYSSNTGCGEPNNAGCNQNQHLEVVPNAAYASVLLSADYHNTFVIRGDGTLWGWGSNDSNQIGSGIRRNNINVPTQIGTDNDWARVSTGYYHVMAIKKNGTLWSWGSNDFGQLGLGTAGFKPGLKNVPKQIGTDKDWIAVSAGDYHSVALKSDHSLWVWGKNNAGQLGTGNFENVTIPTRVGDNDWIQIAAGQSYTLALKQSGSIWSWGNNSYSELGYPTDNYGPNPTPRKVGVDSDWKEVHAGGYNAAIKVNGALWVWGQGVFGITFDKTKWIQIPGSDWQTVSVGNNQGFAFSPRTGWCGWGADNLLNNASIGFNFVQPTQPAQIIGNEFTTYIAGYDYAYAVKADGSLWAWGDNSLGELGSGTFDDIEVPTQVWKIR